MQSINNSTSNQRAIPLVPVLSLATFRGDRHAPLPSLLDGAPSLLVTSGRVAIGLALRAMAVGAGDIVLVPAYHSPSMIPPVHWCGAEVVFYRVHADTTADIADISAKLGARVKAIMVTHFFGIPQDLAPLRALCDAHGIGLLEDCAHCFFGERDGVQIGSSGDYAIGSSMKFFPIYEGGCLVSHRHRLDTVLQPAGAGFEAKAALAALEASFGYGRLAGVRLALALPLYARSLLWNTLKARRSGGPGAAETVSLAPSSSDSSFTFDPRWADKRSSWFSRTVMRRAARSRIVGRRRTNYQALQTALAGAPGWRPLFAALPAGACPWVFPLLADDAERLGAALQAAGVPMVRFGATLWPGVDDSVCANSMMLGRRLIALPCHQELSAAEMRWLADTVRQAMLDTAAP
jgi:dTDP-4-amino-4,6-dideoxygalactose transaminase